MQNNKLQKEFKKVSEQLKSKMEKEQKEQEEIKDEYDEEEAKHYSKHLQMKKSHSQPVDSNDEDEDLNEYEQDEEGEDYPLEEGQSYNNRRITSEMLQLMMQAQLYNLQNMQQLEDQQEQEMIEKAIQESLKENPNPDVMTYEQLQELEDKIGFVSKGFTDNEIRRIPTKLFTSTNEDCSICLDEMKRGNLVKSLSCGHTFHPNCIDQGLKSTKKCPCCMEEHQISS